MGLIQMKMNDKDGLHMGFKNSAQNCAECEFMKAYDYGNRIYYCDHVDRIDDMGKLSVGDIPRGCPGWCPLKKKSNNIDSDLIKMKCDIYLTDKEGKPIEIKVPLPEYRSEIFS